MTMTSPGTSDPDILIVGGGVIGTSALYHLARAGVRARLLERASLCGAASGANAAFIWPQGMKRTLYLEMSLASYAMFPDLSEALGVDLEYRRTGGLIAVDSEAHLPLLRQYLATQAEIGLPAELLDGDEARRREPTLGQSVLAALYLPLGGKINPFRLTMGFARAAQRLGASVEIATPVRGFAMEGDRAVGVLTDRGTIRAGTIIVCAGSWSGEVARLAGLDIPVVPRQGQMVVTEVAPFHLVHCLKPIKHDRDWNLFSQAWPPDPEFGRFGEGKADDPNLPPGRGMALHQTSAGNIILGSTSRFVGLDLRPTEEGIRYILEHAMRILPCLGRLQIIRTWAGLRPFTPDGLPLIGPTGIPGLLLATGHDGGGVGLGPLTGRLVTELVTTDKISFPFEKLTPERFATARPAATGRRMP
jgi:glycine/D-amino acid oxidase-like deaminating enzyme